MGAALCAACTGIRMTQEIVDAPTNEMHTDAFIEVYTALHPQPEMMSLTVSTAENS